MREIQFFMKETGGVDMVDKGCFLRLSTLMVSFFLLTLMLSVSAQAVQINAVTLQKTDAGEMLQINGDASLDYQVFDLDGPPRLILSFPNTSLAQGVTLLEGVGGVVTRVFPVKGETSARIEVSLNKVLSYDISENGSILQVSFSSGVMEKKVAKGESAVIHDIAVRDRGAVTELVLRGEHMDANHNAFMTAGNQQLILDFWGASSRLTKTNFQYATQRIKNVVVGQAEDRVRLVVKLLPVSDMHQQIEATAGEMIVRFGGIIAKTKDTLEVESVDFQPDDRIAHVMIRTDGTDPVISIREKEDHVVIDVKKASLLAGQERSQDVSAFPGPVRQIDSYQLGEQVRVVTRLREKVSITSFQQGNVFTINFEPIDLAMARMNSGARDKFAYTGQKVSFDFKNIEISNALKLIAEMSDLNIIMSDDVSGTLTMRLVDVPWDQALELILSARGLGKEMSGNVMRVAPIEVLRAENVVKLEARRGTQQLKPLLTEFITLSYTKVEDMKKIIDSSSNSTGIAGNVDGGTGLLSSRGSFLVDSRSNTLIIKDTEGAINAVKRLIAKIDTPIKQVLIEGRIVEASDDFQRDIGLSWGGQYNTTTAANFPNTIAIGGTAAVAGKTGGNGLLVDLPAAVATGAGGAIGIALGSFNNVLNLNLELSAAEAEGNVKVISNPRIITTNLQSATISQGFEIPFTSTSQNGTVTQFKKALLSLKVTPQITADNHIIMELLITKDSPSQATTGGGVIINTKKVETKVFMDNGETVVVGGIYTRNQSKNNNSVPFLASIPILGNLFQRNSNIDNRTELLIFITPKILNTASKSR